MLTKVKAFTKRILPTPLWNFLAVIGKCRDLIACIGFILNRNLNASLRDRIKIVKRLYAISFSVHSPHAQQEILTYIETILSLSPKSKGVVVEAGCYRGSSSAKFSLAANIAGKELVIFDSFQGIPENPEPEISTIFGVPASFNKGDYYGPLDEVKTNISKFGSIARCRFVEGWFEETLPKFNEPIAAIYLDVDLASSTRTCLKFLYPLLEPGGVLISQDGHLPLVIDVFNDDSFWANEVGCQKPKILGIGSEKIIKIIREAW